ncbi:amidohydrolase family protein (plasmid) [Variovorax paradoxus]|nr:amidohydrolase family protein [Variovorax paradoxus]
MPTRFGRIYRPDEAWLSRADSEPVLDPDLAIVDAHHHLWDLPDYTYLLPQFLADVNTGHRVVGTVFNECHAMYRLEGPPHLKSVGEVEFANGMAAMCASGVYGRALVNAGIVGFADLLSDRFEEVLELQCRYGGGRFRGVRYAGSWDSDPNIGSSHSGSGPGLYKQHRFQRAVRRLGQLGLSFDAGVLHTQLNDVAELAAACPDTSIVLCHVGSPTCYGRFRNHASEVFSSWKDGMSVLARHENISVKLGGLIIRLPAYDFGRHDRPLDSTSLARLWQPYMSHSVDVFGPGRCMLESNFPVDKIGVGYRTLWNAYKRVFSDYEPSEKEALFSKTATRVYRLSLN